jgi:murein DD-endopeptidase MepM/ murein hydrolase activator NlpD
MSKILFLLLMQISFVYAQSSFVLPVTSTNISSGFGLRLHPIKGSHLDHKGIDIAAKYGSQVRSISEGVVIFSGRLGGYGELIVIKHIGDATTHYGHLSKRLVDVGDTVLKGQFIGRVGVSGAVTGAHLHFEMRINGAAVNPESLLGDIRGKAEG